MKRLKKVIKTYFPLWLTRGLIQYRYDHNQKNLPPNNNRKLV